jgi:hypothetical protein
MTMDDSQLQTLVNHGQAVADRLSADSRYIDATMVMGLIQAVRALRTRLEPPPLVEKPVLAVVPEGG